MAADQIDLPVTVFHETGLAWLVRTEASFPRKEWVAKRFSRLVDRQPAPSKDAVLQISRARALDVRLI